MHNILILGNKYLNDSFTLVIALSLLIWWVFIPFFHAFFSVKGIFWKSRGVNKTSVGLCWSQCSCSNSTHHTTFTQFKLTLELSRYKKNIFMGTFSVYLEHLLVKLHCHKVCGKVNRIMMQLVLHSSATWLVIS